MAPVALPSTRISPPVGRSRSPRRFRKVVFPDPDGPVRAQNSPARRSKSMPFRTSVTTRSP